MNEQDKNDVEAFKSWWKEHDDEFEYQEWISEPAYQAACEYKERELAALRAQLAECQAREAKLREALSDESDAWEDVQYDAESTGNSKMAEYSGKRMRAISRVLVHPQDRSALDAMLDQSLDDARLTSGGFSPFLRGYIDRKEGWARHDALMKAAETDECIINGLAPSNLRRMAEEELKGTS